MDCIDKNQENNLSSEEKDIDKDSLEIRNQVRKLENTLLLKEDNKERLTDEFNELLSDYCKAKMENSSLQQEVSRYSKLSADLSQGALEFQRKEKEFLQIIQNLEREINKLKLNEAQALQKVNFDLDKKINFMTTGAPLSSSYFQNSNSKSISQESVNEVYKSLSSRFAFKDKPLYQSLPVYNSITQPSSLTRN